MNKRNLEYFCIFGGGSIRGVTYAGALRALQENNVKITGYAGSSAGSIAAMISALGYSIEEMIDIYNQFDFMLFRDINFSFKFELAFSKGEVFTDKIREIIQNKLHNEKPVTFKDFPKNLYVLASNITTGECKVFSKETTPDFEVAQAIRISSGFPGLMTPYEIDNEYYIDGDLAKAYALSQISPLLNPKDTRILEFRLEGKKFQKPTENPIEYINNAFDFVCNCATDNIINNLGKKDKYDFVVLDVDTYLFDLSLSKEQREALMEIGYMKTKKFLEFDLIDKKKKLLKIYQQMGAVFVKAYSEFARKNYETSKEILQTYISENYRNFEILDENIIEKLDDCIKFLNENTKKILFIKSVMVKSGEMAEKWNKLNEVLRQKIMELQSSL